LLLLLVQCVAVLWLMVVWRLVSSQHHSTILDIITATIIRLNHSAFALFVLLMLGWDVLVVVRAVRWRDGFWCVYYVCWRAC
jgi:hypothetical protein